MQISAMLNVDFSKTVCLRTDEGEFIDDFAEYAAGSWIRNPHMSKHFPRVKEETLYGKGRTSG